MKRKILYLIVICTLITSVTMAINRVTVSASYLIDKNMNLFMDNVQEQIDKDPSKAYSSNPYDYINENEYYNNIVNLGVEALPSIEKKIKTSESNGLKEYILAIAGEEIAKTNLKSDFDNSIKWTNAKGWAASFDKHLQKIPNEVSNIVTANKAEGIKIEELIDLGKPAIPYIMDYIDKGYKNLNPAIEKLLLEGNKTISNNQIKDIEDLKKDNNIKNQVDILRYMVENAK